jgi:NADH-quinone oxidoreductase subunit J
MAETIAFYTLAVLILGFGLAVITARNTVHSVLYLVLNFLAVALLYVVLKAEFLAVIQVLVYAGGIVVLYLFVVMLVNLKRPPEAHRDPRRRSRLGLVMAGLLLAQMVAIVTYSVAQGGWARPPAGAAGSAASLGGNVERVGWLLYTDYLIPFEVASMLLLVAMIGAIILAKREL